MHRWHSEWQSACSFPLYGFLSSTTKNLEIILNTRLRAEDDVVSVVNKAHRALFYLKRSFAALNPSIFLPLYKFLSGHILNMIFKYPIPSYPATQRH